MPEILEVACDEAGFTGPNLLAKDQRFFSFGSVAVSDEEAFEVIQKVRAAYPVQMPELKAPKLLATSQGRRLVGAALDAVEGRYIVSVSEKLLSLCAWFFEYIYEPVYQDNPRLLYEKNLHRFVAMYAWLWLRDAGSEAQRAIDQFQEYMRSRDPADAPFLFDHPRSPLTEDGKEHPFKTVLRFAYGYRDIIIEDNKRMETAVPDGGRWTLDLSASGLWSHLNHWGRAGKLLSVRCDDSKPLKAIASFFTGGESDPGIRQARRKHNPEALGYKLLEPVAFVNSRDHPAIQLADVVAGTTAFLFNNEFPQECEAIAEKISRHGHPHSVLPEMDVINPANRSAAVNALILYDLAKRAERHGDPYENLAAMYRMAEISWARGDFSLEKGFVGPQS